jgi:transposase
VPFCPAVDGDVHPALVPGVVACRCCPSGSSRSTAPAATGPGWLAGRGGRPASHCMRDIVDAIRYLTHNGPVWRALPADFPPAGTVYWWADKWQADGSAERMHDDLRDRVRAAAGRTAAPTAAIIDSQSVKGAEMIGRAHRGYDAGKKINGQVASGRRGPRPAAHGAGHRHVRAGPRRRETAAVEPAGGLPLGPAGRDHRHDPPAHPLIGHRSSAASGNVPLWRYAGEARCDTFSSAVCCCELRR